MRLANEPGDLSTPSLVQAGLLEAAAACSGPSISDVLASIALPLLKYPPPMPNAEATTHWRRTAASEVGLSLSCRAELYVLSHLPTLPFSRW